MREQTRGWKALQKVPAEELIRRGFTQQTAWTWREGTRRPDAIGRRLLFLMFGIDEDAWWTEAERKQIRDAERVPEDRKSGPGATELGRTRKQSA